MRQPSRRPKAPQRRGAAVSFRISEELKAALTQAAADDHRSVAGLVEKVLAEWLAEHGYLGAPESPVVPAQPPLRVRRRPKGEAR